MFSVRATDQAGNSGSCSSPTDVLEAAAATECPSYTWSVDVSVPVSTIAVGTGGAGGAFTAVDADGGGVDCPERAAGGVCLFNSPAVAFRVSATSAAAASFYECQLDAPEWFTCGIGGDSRIGSPSRILPFRSTATDLPAGVEVFSGLADGLHYFRARTTNAHKTTGPAVEFRWCVALRHGASPRLVSPSVTSRHGTARAVV
jgi:hypothetical protein